jgi:molecular chaperone DnaK (HSP70)
MPFLGVGKKKKPKKNESLVEIPSTLRPPPPTRLQSISKLVIAIDFGTTYTGVAYAYFDGSASLTSQPSNVKSLADNIRVLRKWPNASAKGYQEKTPTVISYGTEPPRWGEKVQSQHSLKVSRFKLGLEPTKVREVYGIEAGELVIGLVPALNKRPVDVTADYLTLVNRYVEDTAFSDEFGKEFLTAQRKIYVITVPAIWSDRAKNLTRQAASKAGIPEEKLLLVTEPEAAALCCAAAGDEVDLDDGDNFLVCDAGGGTVVLIRSP